MKITKFLGVGLLSTFLLTACGGGSASFREDLYYERLLNTSEKYLLIAKAAESYKKLTKYELSTEEYRKGALTETNEKTEVTREFYNKGEYKEYSKVYNKEIENSVKYEVTNEINERAALLDGDKYVVQTESKGARDSYYCEVEQAPTGGYARNSLNSTLDELRNLEAAQRKEGDYFFFTSTHTETYEPVNWGTGETKTLHEIEKTQTVVELNSDYTLKSYSAYISCESNQDPDTHEFKDGLSKVGEYKAYAKFSYGDRWDAPNEVSDALAKYNTAFALGGAEMYIQPYNVAGGSVTPTTYSVMFDYGDVHRKSHSVYHVTASVSGLEVGTNYNGFAINYNGQIVKAGAATGSSSGQLSLATTANEGNALQLANNGMVAYLASGTKAYNVAVEFDIDVSTGVAQIQNSFVYAY